MVDFVKRRNGKNAVREKLSQDIRKLSIRGYRVRDHCVCAEYSEEKGYEISRGKAELVGECRLHNGLYSVGYKRAQTMHSDLEYTADPRWYVHWLSKFLGWW